MPEIVLYVLAGLAVFYVLCSVTLYLAVEHAAHRVAREAAFMAERPPLLLVDDWMQHDPRRWRSLEVCYGDAWRHPLDDSRWEVEFVVDTAELYARRLDNDEVWPLGQYPDRDVVEQLLDGWQAEMPKTGSLSWLMHMAAHPARIGEAA